MGDVPQTPTDWISIPEGYVVHPRVRSLLLHVEMNPNDDSWWERIFVTMESRGGNLTLPRETVAAQGEDCVLFDCGEPVAIYDKLFSVLEDPAGNVVQLWSMEHNEFSSTEGAIVTATVAPDGSITANAVSGPASTEAFGDLASIESSFSFQVAPGVTMSFVDHAGNEYRFTVTDLTPALPQG